VDQDALSKVRLAAAIAVAGVIVTVAPMLINGSLSSEADAQADVALAAATLPPGDVVAAAAFEVPKLENCTVALDDEGDEASCLGNKDVLSEQDVVTLLRDAGFPEEHLATLVCVVKNESSFRPQVRNLKNYDGSQDTGLFQINDLWREDCEMSREDLLDPVNNVQCAHMIYEQRGLNAWYGFTKKKAECRSYQLADAS
jgi:hypothetical protein